jgi:hypothetical protein
MIDPSTQPCPWRASTKDIYALELKLVESVRFINLFNWSASGLYE